MASGLGGLGGYASEAKMSEPLTLPKKDVISNYDIPLFSQVEKHDSDGDILTYVVIGKAALTINLDLNGGILKVNNTVRNEGFVLWQIGYHQNPKNRNHPVAPSIDKSYDSELMGALRGGVVDLYREYFRKILPVGEGLINSSRKMQDFSLSIYSASALSNIDSPPVERLLCDENPHHKFLGKWIVASQARIELEKCFASNDTTMTVDEFEEQLLASFGYLDEKRLNHLLKVSKNFTDFKQRYQFARDTLELIIS